MRIFYTLQVLKMRSMRITIEKPFGINHFMGWCKMPYVTVFGGETFKVNLEKKLVLALEDNGVNILHRCGGNAICTTCRVEILAGDYLEVTNKEKKAFENKGIDDQLFDDGLRLSCQILVNGDITVRPFMTVENTGKDVGPRPAN